MYSSYHQLFQKRGLTVLSTAIQDFSKFRDPLHEFLVTFQP
jgi:hypothetical protein